MSTSYSIFKQRFKRTIAEAIYQEVTSQTAIYYHWFGKENSWTDFLSPFIPSSTTDVPGAPSDNFRYELHVRRDILTAKKVKASDVSYVVRRIDWTLGEDGTGTVYDMYDDAYDTTEDGGNNVVGYYGATKLEDAQFYVLTTDYNVYKCIDNNYNSKSTVMPTGTTPDIFTTSDGYKWKFMYSIPVSLRNRFLSDTYMPVSTALKSRFYSQGSIDVVNIENPGSGYDNSSSNTTAVVTGDGHQKYNPYLFSDIQIDDPGSGYTTLTIEIDPPFSAYVDWVSGGSVALGSYVKHTSGGKDNFYYVVSGTLLGSSGPTHELDGITGLPQTLTNGSCQLRYAGTTAQASATIDGGEVDTVTLDEGGYGYDTESPGITLTGSNTTEAVLTPVMVKTDAEITLVISGGQIVGYTIDNPGAGYTDAQITVVDSTQTEEWNNNNEGGAKLTADFSIGNLDTLQSNVELLATPGSIEVIKVVNSGTGYGAATVTINGDGTGATATATCSGGKVVSIEMTNPGSGYTWTDVVITGLGTGAVARAIMSPLGGHGSNAIDELNANSIVFYTSIARDKNQGIEINNDYRKVGLVRNFKKFGSNEKFTDDIGSGCVLITGTFDSAKLQHDMLVTKDGYKKYRIVDFNNTQILLSVFNNFTVSNGNTLVTDPTNDGEVEPTVVSSNIVVTSVSERTIDQFSGDFLFFSVREPYSPTSEQIITVRTVLTI
jgi:hypothetical protein